VSGVGACEAPGTTVCAADGQGVLCGATPGTPTLESCNGLDDDCDGAVDQGNPGRRRGLLDGPARRVRSGRDGLLQRRHRLHADHVAR
jgi:hypothetical protein